MKKNSAGVVRDCLLVCVGVGCFVWANRNHDTMAEITFSNRSFPGIVWPTGWSAAPADIERLP